MEILQLEKDPNARLDYKFDWSAWLAESELITSKNVFCDPLLGVELESSEISPDGKSVVVWVKGGQLGNAVDVTCHITTGEDREDDRTISLWLKNR